MKKMLFTVTLLILYTLHGSAQKLSIDNVQKVALRNSDAIKEGTEVKGYYFFYVSDKIDKSTNEYTLRITDNNLVTIKDIKFQDSKSVSILESSFNGTDLIFLFYDEKERAFEYQVYGADGKKKFSYTRELTKKEKRYLEMTYHSLDDDEKTYKGLYPIDGKGFISNMPSREDKDYTFQLDYFSSEKRKQWTYTPTVGGKRFVGDFLGAYNGVVYVEVMKFTSNFDGNPDSYILGLDLETGKLLFEKPTDQSKYKFYPASMSGLNGNSFIYGEYFSPNANIMKDQSQGFAFWSIDGKGNIGAETYVSWSTDLGKFLDVTSRGKIADFGYMYVHNLLQTSTGDIYAIGEGYKKVASALGIASAILGGNRGGNGISTVKIKVTDVILIHFDKDFKVKDAKIYSKNSNSVELQSGMEFVSTAMLGKLVKFTYGEFDYAYTQVNMDKTAFTVCYSDYVRGKDYKGATFNSISYNEGKITTDHINTKSSASRSSVLPGRQGQILMLEYFKKDKRLDAHFEKLN